MDNINIYKSNLPYPSLDNIEKNPSWANLIQVSYAGLTSEFSAIAQYTNHYLKINDDYADIHKTLRKITFVEMTHLEILGKLIVKLGGDPGYYIIKNNKHLNWVPSLIHYGSNIKDMLLSDIDAKKASIAQYMSIEKEINNDSIFAILDRIILDEELHLQILYGLYKKYFL